VEHRAKSKVKRAGFAVEVLKIWDNPNTWGLHRWANGGKKRIHETNLQ
jgi:hypothetical protein